MKYAGNPKVFFKFRNLKNKGKDVCAVELVRVVSGTGQGPYFSKYVPRLTGQLGF